MQNYKRTTDQTADEYFKPKIISYKKEEEKNINNNKISSEILNFNCFDEIKNESINSIKDIGLYSRKVAFNKSNNTPEIFHNISSNALKIVKKVKKRCPFCIEKNIFEDKIALIEHCKIIHSQSSPFYCKWCKLKLEGEIIDWLSHMSKYNRNKLRAGYKQSNNPVPCPECGVKVGNRTLYLHMNIKHLHPMKNKCNRCEETFTTYTQMVKHKSNFHGIGKKKNLLCNICGKKFECNSDLKYHVASVHENQRPHMCDFCGKAFKRLGDLNKHRLIHTGERPFQCNICNKTFNRSNSAKKHCINVHGLKITSRINSPFLGDNFPIKKNT